jgi:hypothetical protein
MTHIPLSLLERCEQTWRTASRPAARAVAARYRLLDFDEAMLPLLPKPAGCGPGRGPTGRPVAPLDSQHPPAGAAKRRAERGVLPSRKAE